MSEATTLRDMFAMHAPVTWADVKEVCGWPPDTQLTSDSERVTIFAVMSLMRYEYADAMLAHRAEISAS